jgi:hypothetical protein
MAAPGWYKDRGDPALARWFDGEAWTEHTLVIAEQTPGVRPDPPAGWRTGPSGFERVPEPAPPTPPPHPAPEPEPEPEPEREPEPEPAAWAPPSRGPEPPAAEDDGPPTQPVSAIDAAQLDVPVVDVPRVDVPLVGTRPEAPPVERVPGPASHLEELPPQGRPRVFQDLPPDDAPARFRAPDFAPPDFEGPPSNRFAAMPVSLRVGLVVLLLVAVAVAAMALL